MIDAPAKHQDLEACVKGLVRTIRGRNHHLRCHELARFLAKELITEHGYQAAHVVDGIAVYDTAYLKQLYLDGWESTTSLGVELPVPNIDDFNLRFKEFRVLHSWCKVGDIIIDFHNDVPVDYDPIYHFPNKYMSDFLLISKAGELDGKVQYFQVGKEFGFGSNRFLYILPFYVTKLRTQESSGFLI